jgi:hypothetical protein
MQVRTPHPLCNLAKAAGTRQLTWPCISRGSRIEGWGRLTEIALTLPPYLPSVIVPRLHPVCISFHRPQLFPDRTLLPHLTLLAYTGSCSRGGGGDEEGVVVTRRYEEKVEMVVVVVSEYHGYGYTRGFRAGFSHRYGYGYQNLYPPKTRTRGLYPPLCLCLVLPVFGSCLLSTLRCPFSIALVSTHK